MTDMARWREQQLARQARESAPAREERERRRAEAERFAEIGQATRDRVRARCTGDEPCEWCGNPGTTAIQVEPGEYSHTGARIRLGRYARICFPCIQRMSMVTVVDRGMSEYMEDLKRYRASDARDRRAASTQSQMQLFGQDADNPLLLGRE